MADKALKTPQQLRRAVLRLPDHTRSATRLEAALAARRAEQKTPWYGSQKEHWLGWLADYDGPGAYNRKIWDRSAAYVYNHVVCPPMLLWLAEAAGVPRSSLTKAAAGALAAPAAMSAQSAAIRAEIPWTMVVAHLQEIRP